MNTLHQKLLCLCLAVGCLLAVGLPTTAVAEPYDYDFDQGPARGVMTVNDFFQFHSHLTNTGDNADSYTLTLESSDPENWTFGVCYGGVCYPPTMSEFTVPEIGTLGVGETVDFDFDITSLFDEGHGFYTITLVSNNDGSVVGSWDYDAFTPVDDYALLLAPDGGVQGASVNDFIQFHPVLYNAGTMEDTYTLTMTRDQPENWSTTFCYDGICYPPFQETGRIPDSDHDTIPSAGEVVFDIDFTTLFDEGTGVVTIEVRSDTDPSLVAFASMTVTTGTTVGVGDVPVSLLSGVKAVPNPFNPKTDIRFNVGGTATQDVIVDIFDATGRRIRTLLANDVAPGPQHLTWDGRSDRGEAMAAGVYLASVRAGNERQALKMSLVK